MSVDAAEGATILVVEDNPDNMKLFAWTLEDEGYAFEGVGSAEEALEVLDRRGFDLVLMDISLPGMDGKEATRRLRADPRFARLPILAVTAHAIKGEAEAILEAGVSALVTKPIDEEALLGTIRAHLARGGADG
ncbi:MAG TPA: response regulator [Isosphaeraceae bacterium]|jgi:CheY-like chemotaxis protein|nr:response regulator [Isosphaeraceae bacterium]